MSPLVAIVGGVVVGAVYAIGERSLLVGAKVAIFTAVVGFIIANLF